MNTLLAAEGTRPDPKAVGASRLLSYTWGGACAPGRVDISATADHRSVTASAHRDPPLHSYQAPTDHAGRAQRLFPRRGTAARKSKEMIEMSACQLGRFLLSIAFGCWLFVAPSFAAEWGNLTGRFVLGGAAPAPAKLNITKDVEFCGKHNLVDESLLVGTDGGVANIVIYVRDRDVAVHPDLEAESPAEVTLDNKNCRFEPHVVPLWIGKQSLLLLNSDPVGHNSNIAPIGDLGINPLLPAGGEMKHAFNRKQNVPVPVACNIHPWMTAYVLPRDNPYTAVSAADGTFQLEKLPAGELEFQAWHEKPGYVDTAEWSKGRFSLTIQPGENDLGTIELDLKLFQK